MSGFREQLDARRQFPVAVAQRIALRSDQTTMYALVTEGGDDVYFYSVVLSRMNLSEYFEIFSAAGRSNVIRCLEILDEMGKLQRSFGIVDRDFDLDSHSLLVNGHCLVLDVYSYENFFADRSVLRNIGRAFFALSPGGSEDAEWGSLVDRFLATVPDSLEEEHALAFWSQRQGVACIMGNFSASAHLTIENDGSVVRKANTNPEFIRATGVLVGPNDAAEITQCRRRLTQEDWRRAFRGHYFWELFVRLLDQFRARLIARPSTSTMVRSRMKAQMSPRHALEAAVPFVPIPVELGNFFARIVGSTP